MAKMKVIYTTSNQLENIDIKNGQIIFAADTHDIFMDMKNKRVSYSTIYVFLTEQERIDYPNPAQGFYYVDETHILWRYKNKWIKINPEIDSVITFGKDVDTFPIRGEEHVLYCADNAIYKWFELENKYKPIANINEWDEL